MSEETNRLTDETEEFPDEPILPEGVDRAEMRRVNGKSRLFDFVEMLVLTVVAVLLISSFLVRHTLVQGGSMNNTLFNKDKMLVSGLFYKPKVGDVVVFKKDEYDPNKALVKRVIAVEGPEINMDFANGIVYIDGVAIK